MVSRTLQRGAVGLFALIGVALLMWLGNISRPKTAIVYALLYVGRSPAADIQADSKAEAREDVFRQTQVILLRSHGVLELALKRVADANLAVLRTQGDSRAWLERELQVEAFPNTKTIRIGLRGDHPEELARIVNAVVHAFLDEVVASDNREHRDRLARCARLVRENTDGISKGLAELQAVCRQLQGNSQPSRLQFQLAFDRSTALQQELEAVAARLAKARIQLDRERQQGPVQDNQVAGALVEAELAKDPEVAQWRVQIVRMKRAIARHTDNARSDGQASALVKNSLKGYQEDLAAAQQKLDRRREEVRSWLAKQLQQILEESSKESIKKLEAQIAQWTEEEYRLRSRLASQVKETEDLARKSWVDVELHIKEIERKLDAAQRFSRELEHIRGELQNAPRVQLILEAAWPQP